MARMPLTKEEVVPTKLVLNVEKIGLTEEQFLQLCRDNQDQRVGKPRTQGHVDDDFPSCEGVKSDREQHA